MPEDFFLFIPFTLEQIDLKCVSLSLSAIEDSLSSDREVEILEDLKLQLVDRPVWMASSIHKGEEKGWSLSTILYD